MSHCQEKFVKSVKMSANFDYSSKEEEIANRHRSRYNKLTRFTKLGFVFAVFYCITSSLVSFTKLHGLNESFELPQLTSAYLNVLQHSNLAGNWSETYTAEAHLAGTNYGLVEFTAEKFEEFGFKSSIEAFNVYINYPKEYALRLLKNDNVVYEPTLVEDELEKDKTTSGEGLIPAFHGYSANGNVTSQIVYANYGTKQDFKLLEENGVQVEGNVVIVRYGDIFRGLKVKFAQEAGAIGVLIYSDPADDYVPKGVELYPDGPGRNPSSIQRGSVQFLSSLPGDPARFTDGSPEALANLTSIPHIPSLPISYKEAEPILKTLNGHGLDLGFKGGLESFDYTTGPTKKHTLNIYNNNDYNFTDIYNVYGYLEGEQSDKVILIGNHRDAWIKGGAGDPNSGSAVLLEIARALGELVKLGYKPRYSIALASWDGEEYALLGSTAYAEKYAEKLGRELVTYINLDAAVTGTHLRIGASPLLNSFLLNIAKNVQYPDSDYSLYHHFTNESKIHILGSGSDYTSFFEHLGVTSFDVGFSTGVNDPVYHYHSNYDSYYWISEFADPGFKFHNTLAQYLGLIILNFSEKKVAESFNAKEYAVALQSYFHELVEKIPHGWLTHPINYEHDESLQFCHFREINNAAHHNYTLGRLISSTNHELKNYIKVSHKFDKFTNRLQIKWEDDVSNSKNPFKKFFFNKKVNNANNKLFNLEKQFLYENGLNGRDWFKHIVFASGRYTGYAGQTLPGLTEAIEDLDFEQTARWIGIIKRATTDALVSLV